MFNIKEIDIHTLSNWLETGKNFRLIDVRSVAEFAQGMIPKGEQLPLHLLPVKADDLEQNSEIVLYCRTGARSAQACAFLAARGFDKVYNLQSGIMGWAQLGKPIVDPSQAVA